MSLFKDIFDGMTLDDWIDFILDLIENQGKPLPTVIGEEIRRKLDLLRQQLKEIEDKIAAKKDEIQKIDNAIAIVNDEIVSKKQKINLLQMQYDECIAGR